MIANKKVDKNKVKRILTFFIASVWLINGVFCKILNLVPRHQMIVSRILDEGYAPMITKFIGILELGMVFWILSKIKSDLCAFTQILVVTAMVIMEIILTPDLLLFGRANVIPAILFILIVYLNQFYPNFPPKLLKKANTLS